MKKSKEEIELRKNLQNPVYVNYNLLLLLKQLNVRIEDTNKILLALFEVNKELLQTMLEEREQQEKNDKKPTEGVIR